jgi:hypothetical protein
MQGSRCPSNIPRWDSSEREHLSSPDCWCGPEEIEPGVWVHRETGYWDDLEAIFKAWQ